MAENIENLEFQEISEIPVTENKSGIYAISVDTTGEAKAYPLDNFKTADEVDKELKDKADLKDLKTAQSDINNLKSSKANQSEFTEVKIDLGNAKSDISNLEKNKLDRSELANMQVAIKRYKDSVNNISDLPQSNNEVGDGRVVDNDKDSQSNSFIWVWDGSVWSRTPFTRLPSDIVTDDLLSIQNSPFDIPILGTKSKRLIELVNKITLYGYDVSKRYRLFVISYHTGTAPNGIAIGIAENTLPEDATSGFDIFRITNYDVSRDIQTITLGDGTKKISLEFNSDKFAENESISFLKNSEGLLRKECFSEYSLIYEKHLFGDRMLNDVSKSFIHITPSSPKSLEFRETQDADGNITLSWNSRLVLQYDNSKYKFIEPGSITFPSDYSKLAFAYVDIDYINGIVGDIKVSNWANTSDAAKWKNSQIGILRYIVAMRGYSGFVEWDSLGYNEYKVKTAIGQINTNATYSILPHTSNSINNTANRLLVSANSEIIGIDGKIKRVSLTSSGAGIIKLVHFRELTAGTYTSINVVELNVVEGNNVFEKDIFMNMDIYKGDVFGVANDKEDEENSGISKAGVKYAMNFADTSSFFSLYLVDNKASFSKTSLYPSSPNKIQIAYSVEIEGSITDSMDKIEKRVASLEENPSGKRSLSSLLYESKLTKSDEWTVPNSSGVFSENGLKITGTGLNNTLVLNRQYNLNKRRIRYIVQFGADSRMLFLAKEVDRFVNLGTITEVDAVSKKLRIYNAFNAQTNTLPTERSNVDIPFDIVEGRNYVVEFIRNDIENKITLMDTATAQSVELSDISKATGRQYDFYGLCLYSGSAVSIKGLRIISGQANPDIIIYGDSITDGMYLSDPSKRYAQLIIDKMNGNGLISGRGGGAIGDLIRRIKNELPYLLPKYCMVMIGTNGGNTEANLSELVEYIKSLGVIPILNNIPCAGNGRQIAANAIINTVRTKYNINGCLMDIPTSLDYDGADLNEALYNSDSGAWVHTNEKGMYEMSMMF